MKRGQKKYFQYGGSIFKTEKLWSNQHGQIYLTIFDGKYHKRNKKPTMLESQNKNNGFNRTVGQANRHTTEQPIQN